ncbi:putative F-box domain, FBD domain, leucine-rich repeat domain, L domain-containing protein [Medicago truncatula]|uniref:F-box/RNI/FBD-like domain protein n=1 Tax=Medicago truncatula TaxID=3880 RepID=A0A072TQF7_MEDTR|nr:F-box/FBD/LRR-repeat protein At5g56420 [Medicago truncatula]KEH19421.1 F-box/RNI/FBD-like domain protein [Medicago truncatula]RHN40899.1 putative F-box domain, FBD domain, leucine-rich repeat domain, L domain-containing protein [Medicago truncatula]
MAEEEENNADVIDRMSSLPDSLLCHILSFLPTKTSVMTTSLVSRRWRHLWEHLNVFVFDDKSNCNCRNPKKFRKFAFFVSSVLSLRKSRHIRKFHLTCCTSDVYSFPGECVYMWVRAAIGPHLEDLSLNITNCHGDDMVYLPPSLLNCTNLVSLSLFGLIHLKFQPSAIHFPSLKMLKVEFSILEHNIDIEDFGKHLTDSILVFLSGCPVLETLDTYFSPYFLTRVPVPPSAKRLKLTDVKFSWTCLEIDSDGLGIEYGGCNIKPTFGIIGNLQSMEEAYLDFFSLCESEFIDPMLKYLRDLDGDLHLLLRHSTSKKPLRSPILNYPEFCNLHHLKFIIPCFNTNLLLNVLEKCHMLKVLIIQSSKDELSPSRTWEPKSTSVPKCLESHLTYIHIEGYQGFEDELAFAEYILRNGIVLHTMLIFFDTSMDLSNKNCSIKSLTDIPRGSVTCQLKFDSAVSS